MAAEYGYQGTRPDIYVMENRLGSVLHLDHPRVYNWARVRRDLCDLDETIAVLGDWAESNPQPCPDPADSRALRGGVLPGTTCDRGRLDVGWHPMAYDSEQDAWQDAAALDRLKSGLANPNGRRSDARLVDGRWRVGETVRCPTCKGRGLVAPDLRGFPGIDSWSSEFLSACIRAHGSLDPAVMVRAWLDNEPCTACAGSGTTTPSRDLRDAHVTCHECEATGRRVAQLLLSEETDR